MMWNRQNIFILLSTITTTVVTYSYLIDKKQKTKKKKCTNKNDVKESYDSLIGNTPLFYLPHASKHKNVQLYVKLESSNPGGTGKDRAAYYMLRHAEQNGHLPNPNDSITSSKHADKQETMPQTTTTTEEWKMCQLAMEKTRTGGIVVEGTSGSTGISLATLCASRGHACMIVMPDDQSKEKQNLLQTLGAILYVVPTASISNPNHYVNIARRMTQMINDYNNNQNKIYQACFIDQFENLANFQAHYEWTGPELLQQLSSHYNDDNNNNNNTKRKKKNNHLLFCMSSGTGGTLAGVGKYLTEQIIPSSNTTSCFSNVTLALVDPPGSALYNKVKYNVAYTSQQREQHFIKNQYNTIAEGIGLDRVTANFALALPYLGKNAVTVSDQTAVDIAHYLYQYYGLFVGSSSAMNVAALLQLSSSSKKNLVGVTMICDTGQRHVTRFWNRDYIVNEWKLQWPLDDPTSWKVRLKPYIDLT